MAVFALSQIFPSVNLFWYLDLYEFLLVSELFCLIYLSCASMPSHEVIIICEFLVYLAC